ncbi:MAG TPA: hypothetical protein PKE27_18145 [Povalibacter sp.]|uniref:hypothetical protein n=1 Tax=Povalibacter sp. TaxID=1962978 RepID=UPI002BD9132E|nr:hypothetical protein [Povalibacter sp.]HMN46503.1 hypothetical protein [Povalibacter sp.]
MKSCRRPKIVLASLCFAALVSGATGANAAEQPWKNYEAPRTAFGQPDLQGNWTNATLTPLEREAKFGDRLTIPADEAQTIESAEADANEKANLPTDPKLGIKDLPHDCGRGFTGVNCGYNSFWVDPGTQVMQINGEYRTSMIVDPPNGKVPPLLPEARQAMAARYAARSGGSGNADGPEVRSLGERCILSFGSSAGPPMIPLLYNNNYQIVQNRDTVLILVEMVHDARIVRLDAKHGPSTVRKWMGDSVGRWEGDTLVVETINFPRQQSFRGASQNLKVTERFTRVEPGKILYEFQIDDPGTFTQPWRGQVAMNATNEKIYEYACHEGNYALPGILAGAREAERQAASGEGAKK